MLALDPRVSRQSGPRWDRSFRPLFPTAIPSDAIDAGSPTGIASRPSCSGWSPDAPGTPPDGSARLYLSHRTVENKLHAVYEKLGVEGRAELAEALEGA